MTRQLDSAGTCLPEFHSSSGMGHTDMCGGGWRKLLISELFLPGGESFVLQGRERGEDSRRSRC